MSETPVEPQDTVNQREWERLTNWSGWTYSSKLDTRLWVPKRGLTGSGAALNVGHPGAKLVIAGLCVVPVAVVLMFTLLWSAR